MSLFHLAVAAVLAGAALSLIMASAWYVQRRSGKSGWIDAVWSFGVGGVAVCASLFPLAPDRSYVRQIAVATLVAMWCLRLGLHIAVRNRIRGDDPRYRHLIVQWGEDAARRMFWFLQSQAAVGLVLVVSVVVAARNPTPGLRVQDVVGLAALIIAVVGEAIADRQLRAFNGVPANRNAVCDVGLWRWSRHPNYFFEWLAWLAYPIIAVDLAGYNPYGWLAVAAPLCMYWVLVHVSGIPPLEDHMLRSRGDAFRAYQRRTRPFLPLPRRR